MQAHTKQIQATANLPNLQTSKSSDCVFVCLFVCLFLFCRSRTEVHTKQMQAHTKRIQARLVEESSESSDSLRVDNPLIHLAIGFLKNQAVRSTPVMSSLVYIV